MFLLRCMFAVVFQGLCVPGRATVAWMKASTPSNCGPHSTQIVAGSYWISACRKRPLPWWYQQHLSRLQRSQD